MHPLAVHTYSTSIQHVARSETHEARRKPLRSTLDGIVSIGTIGGLATLEKLNQTSAMDAPFQASIFLLFASILVALDMARPKVLKIWRRN
jgi:hypothetical protein